MPLLQIPNTPAKTMRMNMPTYQRLLIWTLSLTLFVSVAFTAFPGLDLIASSLFYRGGFRLHDIPFLQSLRLALIWSMYGFALFVLAVFVYRLIRRQPLRAWAFSLAVILVGPLGLVNGILKAFWGRARPADIVVFGGDKTFTPAWFYADQCDLNCSFTSGEGAAAATTTLLVLFLAWPRLKAKGRRWLGAFMGLFLLLTAGLRVAVGQHFLSDTLLSILLCALVALVLYPLFFSNKTRWVSLAYQRTRARHPEIGQAIEIAVPMAAAHRPAVEAFLQGKYFEGFSHRAFKHILTKRGGNAVHAGAFFGDMLHTLSCYAETVYAFEPVLDNYILAKKNCADLGLQNVFLLNAALGAGPGFATMKTYTDSGEFRGGAASIVRHKNRESGLERVPVLALDTLGLDNISLLHLDIEGYESVALDGAKELIARCKPIVLLEDTPQQCGALLEPLGYRLAFRRGSLAYWALPEDSAIIAPLKPE